MCPFFRPPGIIRQKNAGGDCHLLLSRNLTEPITKGNRPRQNSKSHPPSLRGGGTHVQRGHGGGGRGGGQTDDDGVGAASSEGGNKRE